MLAHGWDGEWFLRAYDDFGDKVGSPRERRGPDLHRAAGLLRHGRHRRRGRARRIQALDSVERAAGDTATASCCYHPAYTRYHLELGRDLHLPAGLQGERRHLLPQQPVGHDRRDDGRARRPGVRLLPADQRRRTARSISEVHRCEPYVYAQMIAGKEAARHGEAKNSWLTGTAAWNFVAVTQYLLGVRPDYDGLVVDPLHRPGRPRVHRHPPGPRRDVRHPRGQLRRQGGPAHRRRHPGRRAAGALGAARRDGAHRRGGLTGARRTRPRLAILLPCRAHVPS